MLPFDITLAGANEYGAMTAAKIFGVEILNEGSGISIDDAVSEAQATFVARGVEPMQAVPSPPDQGISSFPQQRNSRTRGRSPATDRMRCCAPRSNAVAHSAMKPGTRARSAVAHP